jgi:hypothetical protein
MSSTNRGNSRDFHVADYYKTPVSSILDFIMEFNADFGVTDLCFTNGDKLILDPCAGGNVETKEGMSYPEALLKYEYVKPEHITTVDIREDSEAQIKTDYLNLFDKQFENKYDVIITNPPFATAREIIDKALHDVKENGLVIMLLRLNFFGSQERQSWWQKQMPFACYVHSKRMKFYGTKNTDSIEYCHCVWEKNNYPRFCKIRII